MSRPACTAGQGPILAARTGIGGIVAAFRIEEAAVPISLFGLIYLAIGVVVALTHGYTSVAGISEVLSLLVAIVLWPLVLFGVDLHLPAITT
ncbi:MAG: hypothetical protein JWR41_2720 [Modestobacter sp.]|nr:hypothetical protein [Modestobacter sp.]